MNPALIATLPKPARYFPLEKGVYEVAPGLRTLGTDFGNGTADSRLFQLDTDYAKYRENRLASRAERLGKYVVTRDFRPEVEKEAVEFLIRKLTAEYPELFILTTQAGGNRALECRLTEETLVTDSNGNLVSTKSAVTPPYASAYDALCSQLQEDIAILATEKQSDGSTRDWLAALSLCSPSHWAAEDKIGKTFFAIHEPIPGIEKINRAAAGFVDAMVNKGPYVRFVWGFGTDDRLNHHPIAPSGWDPKDWSGRSFDRNRPGSPFILRVERQVLHGLPAVGAGLFAIRVSFIEGTLIRKNPRDRDLLKSALLSMNPASRGYKGLEGHLEEVLKWLDESP